MYCSLSGVIQVLHQKDFMWFHVLVTDFAHDLGVDRFLPPHYPEPTDFVDIYYEPGIVSDPPHPEILTDEQREDYARKRHQAGARLERVRLLKHFMISHIHPTILERFLLAGGRLRYSPAEIWRFIINESGNPELSPEELISQGLIDWNAPLDQQFCKSCDEWRSKIILELTGTIATFT